MAGTGVRAAPSGIERIDEHWGGFRQGATYLVYGRSLQTYRLLSLRFLRAGIRQRKPCLFISAGRPENLGAHATLAGLDVRQAYASGLLQMIRFATPAALQALDDDERTRAFSDLVMLMRRHQPQRVVLDDLRPFLDFTDSSRLSRAADDLINQVATLNATLVLGLTEPEETAASPLTTLAATAFAGRIHVESVDEASAVQARRLTLMSDNGHSTDHATFDIDFAAPTASHLPAGPPAPIDRDAFSLQVQQRFHRHAVNGTPFLLIAMRGENAAARTLDFEPLQESVRELLDAQDTWMIDLARRRVVVALARPDPHVAQRFFARLRVRLSKRVQDQASTYLQAFTAIVLPNGGSFQSAEEFLTTALDEA